MKSILAISMVLLFASCTKDFTCECVETYEGAEESYTKTISTTEINDTKKQEAEETCNAMDEPEQTIFTETRSVDCELK